MIDLKKLSIYHKYNGNPESSELYNERLDKWLNDDITMDEFMIIDKIDQNFVCIRSGGYSAKMIKEMELEILELKQFVTDEAYEYLKLDKTLVLSEEPKLSLVNRLMNKILNK